MLRSSRWAPRTLRARGTDPARSALFLDGVATTLGRCPPGEALLVEGRWGEAFPSLTPLGHPLDAAVRELARRLGIPLGATAASDRPRTARGGAAASFGLAVPGPTGDPDPAEGGRARPPEPAPRPFPLARPADLRPGWEYQAHWFSRSPGRLGVYLRFRLPARGGASSEEFGRAAIELGVAADLAGAPVTLEGPLGASWRRRREWAEGRLVRFRAPAALEVSAAAAAALLPARPPGRFPSDGELLEHVVVLGASGGGKTSFLADVAARRIAEGKAVVAVDVHGDLSPAIASRLPAAARARLVAVDATAAEIPGLALLGGPGEAGADLVAALKRLTADGGEVYWGFRIERVLESFVRLAAEEGGSLADVAELLTDARRREAARRTTGDPALARFLDDLGPILRRNPEFLWPAAARVAKVLLSPRLRALLAPAGPGLPLAALLRAGRGVLFRLPTAELGPEAAGLAATLLLTRTYLLLARGHIEPGRLGCLVVVDEAHALSPRLLVEILAEGRKFGVGIVLASQYPERLHPELRAAAAGSAGAHLLFRVPPAAAATAGGWIGLAPLAAQGLLPSLPRGAALVRSASTGGGPRLFPVPPLPPADRAAWDEAVATTARAHGADPVPERGRSEHRAEALLLPLFAAGPTGPRVPRGTLLRRALAAAPEAEPAELLAELDALERRGWVRAEGEEVAITPAGERGLGVGGATGAPSESAEHRALLLESARLLARRGERVEILAQGRFDTRLPDALLRLLPPLERGLPPCDLAERLAQRKASWAWRFFGGRDVHVEAEVTGALRPERIRHGLAKARRAGAFALFVVADAPRARRVRKVLRAEGVGVDRAQVWTLGRARAAVAATPEGA